MPPFLEYVVIDGAEHRVHIGGDDAGWTVKTGAECHCGSTDWDVEHRDDSGHVWVVCEQGHEFQVQHRQEKAS